MARVAGLPGVTGGLQADHPLMLPATEFHTYLHSLGMNASAVGHDATGLPHLQPPGNTSSAQHAHSLATPFHLLCTLASVAYVAMNALVALLWSMGISYPQANSWVHEQKVAVTTKLWLLITSWVYHNSCLFTLRSMYEAVGIALGRLVGVGELGVQLEELSEQLEAARGELAKNLITRQADELAAARGNVAEQASCVLKAEATLEGALVSLVRGDWGSTRMLDVVSSALGARTERRTCLQMKSLASISDTALHTVSDMTHLTSIDLVKSPGFSETPLQAATTLAALT